MKVTSRFDQTSPNTMRTDVFTPVESVDDTVYDSYLVVSLFFSPPGIILLLIWLADDTFHNLHE